MANDLQFDKADFGGTAALSCAACKVPITDEYFQANGQTVCPACRAQIAQFGDAGSKVGRMARASLVGVGAAFAGFLLYWGILAVTGYELGLIAIVVGWLVGAGVRWGSNQRGGLFYQLMAVALTYISICGSYVPMIAKELSADAPYLVKLIVAIPLSWAAPFLAGFENVIGWIIIGIGLWQAWSMNRKVEIEVRGPFKVGAGAPS